MNNDVLWVADLLPLRRGRFAIQLQQQIIVVRSEVAVLSGGMSAARMPSYRHTLLAIKARLSVDYPGPLNLWNH